MLLLNSAKFINSIRAAARKRGAKVARRIIQKLALKTRTRTSITASSSDFWKVAGSACLE